MSEFTQEPQSSEQKLPSLLNVLTILTMVGSSIALLSGLYTYFTVCNSLKEMEKLDMDEMGGGALSKMMEGAAELIAKQCEHRLTILLVTLIASGLCLFGALQMRKWQRSGFILYTIGELLGPIAILVLLGTGGLGMLAGISSFVVPVVFVILYFTQRKYLR